MRYALQLNLLIILIGSIYSCKGTKKTSTPIEKIPPLTTTQTSKINTTDFDYYFTGTQTITSTKGPQNITRNILQDKNGSIWLATWEGIIMYDGTSFTNMTNKEGLRRFRAFTLLEDRNGHIWIGTIGAGVYRYDGTAFTNFTTEDGLVNNEVGCLYEDTKGHIWMGTQGGISCYNGKSFQNFTTKEGLTDNDVNSIIEDKTGKFWIATRGVACWYDGTAFTKFTTIENRPFTNVRTIIKDKNNNMWLGGNDGLWRYDGLSFLNYTKNFVGYIYEDSKGDIWTHSEGDYRQEWVLSRYKAMPLHYEMATATPIKKEENMFFGIVEDTGGNLWLGSLRGVCRFDGVSFDCFE